VNFLSLLVVLEHIYESVFTQSRKCLGCALDDPQKGLQSQALLVTSFSEDFWGSSIGEIDIPIGLLQRSFASVSTSNLSFHSDLASVGSHSNNAFVNNGKSLHCNFGILFTFVLPQFGSFI